MWPQIPVVFDCADIIKNEATVATVVVADDTREHHYSPQSMF